MGDAAPPPRPSADALRRAKARAKEELGTLDGVQGVGIGDGTLRVYVRDQATAEALPATIDGVPVEAVVIGEATAF